MYATYVIKTNARSVLTRFTVGGSITDYIDDPAKGPPGEVSKCSFESYTMSVSQTAFICAYYCLFGHLCAS